MNVSRRLALPLSAALLLLVAAATPAAAARPGSNHADVANIQVLNSRSFTDNGYLNIVGDLKNTTDAWRTALEVKARLFNGSGVLLKHASVFTEVDLVRPHTRAPFRITTLKPAHYDHYSLSTSSDTTNARPIGHLAVTQGTPYVTPPGDESFPGHVRNENAFGVDSVEVIATLFDSNGRVVNTDWNYTNPSHIAAHATKGYVVTFIGHYSGGVTVRIQVQAVHS